MEETSEDAQDIEKIAERYRSTLDEDESIEQTIRCSRRIAKKLENRIWIHTLWVWYDGSERLN